MKKCERCREEFECTQDEHCWCFEYSVAAETLKQIRKTYGDCLCPNCLAHLAKAKSNNIA